MDSTTKKPQEARKNLAGRGPGQSAKRDGMTGLKQRTKVLPEPLEILRSEVNLLTLPFFALCDKDVRRRTKTEFTEVQERDGAQLQILWRVTGDPELGYPGPVGIWIA